MKRYKLKKDLPTFKAGDLFHKIRNGNLVHTSTGVLAYMHQTLEKFPNILKDWFEEIPEDPKTVWDLKEGDECWARSSHESPFGSTPVRADKRTWFGSPLDKSLREIGGIFLTEEECKRDIEWQKAKQILLRDTKGFKPDWSDSNQNKTLVYYSSDDKTFRMVPWSVNAFGGIYFGSLEDAEASIEAHEKEWKTYLGLEE